MKIHIITIFPDAFNSFLETSMLWKAIKNKLVDISLYKLSDFSDKNFGHVDDNAYGMHGQVISPEPLGKAIEHVFRAAWKKIPVVYMSPSWELLKQEKVEKDYNSLVQNKQMWEFLIICGHYEWIDQRIIDLYVDKQVSIWEYVLTSWEIAAQVYIDALVRHIPWVLWNAQSLKEDSFSKKFDRQKEYPVYTRPQVFREKKVPDVLLSGDPKKIEDWKNGYLYTYYMDNPCFMDLNGYWKKKLKFFYEKYFCTTRIIFRTTRTCTLSSYSPCNPCKQKIPLRNRA